MPLMALYEAMPLSQLAGIKMTSRRDMNTALKAFLLRRLREMGFSGSYPHLRREHDGLFDLMTFQFDRHGGALTVEVSRCFPTGIQHPVLGHIPAHKAKAHDRHPLYRKRLGEPSQFQTDAWFKFSEKDAGSVAEAILSRLSEVSLWEDLSPEGSETPYK